jgi:pyruvate/2-oxoglutarate dehydrogenase complex dihydrolipoamide acyltransferase (E2) component
MSTKKINAPQTNVNDENVILTEWNVKDEDFVEKGDTIGVVESSKATIDIEAEFSGYIRIGIKAGEEIPVGSVLGFIAKDIESLPAIDNLLEGNNNKNKVTKKAQKLAVKHNINLEDIKVNGIISEKEIIAFIENTESPSTGKETKFGVPAKRIYPLNPIKKAVSISVQKSLDENSLAYLLGEADVTDLLNKLGSLTEKNGVTISLTDCFVFLVSRIISDFPLLNSTLINEGIYEYSEINIGITIDENDSLYIPVLRNADQKSLEDLTNYRMKHLLSVFRKEIVLDSLSGGTFTITVLDKPSINYQLPIVFPNQSGILGLGSVQESYKKIQDGVCEFRKILGLTLAYDHRLVNGNYAALFLQALTDGVSDFIWDS